MFARPLPCWLIPAWAGNTHRFRAIPPRGAVHPRVGGEHPHSGYLGMRRSGSSPRGRGTPSENGGRNFRSRFIPAWAGNTSRRPIRTPGKPVHPRVGGEHSCARCLIWSGSGSSPRGRGTQCARPGRPDFQRFIPAWAGNTDKRATPWHRQMVHPRVGGEHRLSLDAEEWVAGSSPRGRGTLPRGAGGCGQYRFIPAWAGNTVMSVCMPPAKAVHPRVGGEHSKRNCCVSRGCGSSPRGRGTPGRVLGRILRSRFIPAWAGNTRKPPSGKSGRSVHPRVGGEHSAASFSASWEAGSSPRGRGTPPLP